MARETADRIGAIALLLTLLLVGLLVATPLGNDNTRSVKDGFERVLGGTAGAQVDGATGR